MSLNYDDSSLESWCSNSSLRRSERERRKKYIGVIHFYSDGTTATVNDVCSYVRGVPVANNEYCVIWEGREEKIRLVQVGGSMEEAKEAQVYFERLMAASVPVTEAVELCGYPAHANARIRKEKAKSCSLKRRRQECVAAIPAEEQIQDPTPQESNENNDAIVALTQELRNARSDAQKGDICLKYAALFHASGEEKVVLYPGYNISIGRNAKTRIVHSTAGKPAKMQRQLLLELKGREYIMKHSATGQRFGPEKCGLPAADKDTLSAVELFVKFKCPGIPCPAVASTFNKLSGNLRMYEQRKGGVKYNYPRKSTKSDAANVNTGDIPSDVRRILEGLEEEEGYDIV